MATLPDISSLDAGLPANIDAEKTILGAILLDNAAHAEAAERLQPDDFSLDSHRRIFLRMGELINAQRAVDIVTLSNELARAKEIEAVGGVAYLASLTEGLPRRPVIEEYIRIVKDKSLLRKLMLICSAAIARAADQSETALEVLGAAEAACSKSPRRESVTRPEPLDQIVADSFGSIDNLYKQSREVTGLATGFNKLDRNDKRPAERRTHHHCRPALHGQDRPCHQHCAEHGHQSNAIVAIFSLEMSKESLLRRMLASQAWVDQRSCKPASSPAKTAEAAERAERAGGVAAFYRRYAPASPWRKCEPRRAGSSRQSAGWTWWWSTTSSSCRPLCLRPAASATKTAPRRFQRSRAA